MQQLWLAVIGLSAGAVVAGGVFSFIIGLGVVSDFADRTHTGEHIRLYEDAIALGGILGTVFLYFSSGSPAVHGSFPCSAFLEGFLWGAGQWLWQKY